MIEGMDESLLPLFQMEAESQCSTLNEGIIILEQDPTHQPTLDALMRSAHALKGAAAVVGLEAAVQVAHAMEDCLTAAIRGRIQITSDCIDLLLKGTDTLSSMATLNLHGFERWQKNHQKDAISLAASLHELSQGQTTLPSATIKEDVPTTPPPKTVTTQENQPQEQALRINSKRLDALMELAGEVQLSAKQIEPIQQKLFKIHQEMANITLQLEKIRFQPDMPPHIKQRMQSSESQLQQCRSQLTPILTELQSFERKSSSISQRLSYEVQDSRMQTFGDAAPAFRRTVRDLARTLEKSARLNILGETCWVDRDIMEKMQAPMQHFLRNALDHGIESAAQRIQMGKPEEATITIEARHQGGMLHLSIQDDGRGIHLDQLRQSIVEKGLSTMDMLTHMSQEELLDFLFLPQFSMKKEVSNISGRGVGLDLVANTIRSLRGTLTLHSEEGHGCRFDIRLPLSLSTVRCILVSIHHEEYAIHLTRIAAVESIQQTDIQHAEGRQYMRWRKEKVGLIYASQLFSMPQKTNQDAVHVLIFQYQKSHYGVVVDDLLGEGLIIEKSLGTRLGKIRNIASGAINAQGDPLLVIDVDDMLQSIQTLIRSGALQSIPEARQEDRVIKKQILVVEDSITVREAERRMLENHGYHVTIAVDGMDGWNALRAGDFDLVITDIDMPRMNGIELLRMIRSDERTTSLPVMVVSYKDREEDRLAGMEAGANYYLTKSSFHDHTMLDGVHDLIGHP